MSEIFDVVSQTANLNDLEYAVWVGIFRDDGQLIAGFRPIFGWRTPWKRARVCCRAHNEPFDRWSGRLTALESPEELPYVVGSLLEWMLESCRGSHTR